MQTRIVWSGKRYHSIENCILTTTNVGNEISSIIIGDFENEIFKVEYNIKANKNWETISVISQIHSARLNELVTLEKKDGGWLLNGNLLNDLKDVFDIDISLTPFTNTLPINRLKLTDNERQIIEVLYVDILGKQVRPVTQSYTRLASDNYVYENCDSGFVA